MRDLNALAREYVAFVGSDNRFQRRARVLQSMWRHGQCYDIGVHTGPRGTYQLGSRLPMPWAECKLRNYLTCTIRKVVKAEIKDPQRSAGKLYSSPRIFNDLLSSQPLCFNLFGELQQDLPLATTVFQDLAPGRVGRVTAVQFEHSPGRGDPKYLDDNTAFDVYVQFLTPAGRRGFAGIEVKYHEDLGGRPASHRPRYDEVAAAMDCFWGDALRELRRMPLQQIWRDHLLAGAVLNAGGHDDGFFVFLCPRDNYCCAEAVRRYRCCLRRTESFMDWTMESVCESIKRHTDSQWIDHLVDRYLNFDKLASASQPAEQ